MYKKNLEKLEYNIIKEQLINLCKTFNGKEKASQLEPYTDPEIVQNKLDETNTILDLVNSFGNLPISNFEDISPIFKRLESNMSLSISSLLQMKDLLTTSRELSDFFNNAFEERSDAFENVQCYFSELYINLLHLVYLLK